MMDPFTESRIREEVFLESENCLVVYNVSPILPGHSLVITKKQFKSILELRDEELFEFVRLAQQATRLLCRAFKTEHFNWTLQEGVCAGQTVPHLHLHLIPRHKGDLPHPGDWYPKLKQYENGLIDSEKRPRLSNVELKQIVSHLRGLARTHTFD
jgi:bis(5'-adenosyl)-triphosphatase